jgi:hypothetical protein
MSKNNVKDNETKIDYELVEGRDQYLFELINGRFRLEWDRSNNLDEKAIKIIESVGVVASIVAIIGGTFVRNSQMNVTFIHILMIVSVILLICAIVFGLIAYRIERWKIAPDTAYLIKEYAKKDRQKIDIIRLVSAELSESIEYNKIINDKKVKYINHSILLFTISIIAIVIIYLYVLVTYK